MSPIRNRNVLFPRRMGSRLRRRFLRLPRDALNCTSSSIAWRRPGHSGVLPRQTVHAEGFRLATHGPSISGCRSPRVRRTPRPKHRAGGAHSARDVQRLRFRRVGRRPMVRPADRDRRHRPDPRRPRSTASMPRSTWCVASASISAFLEAPPIEQAREFVRDNIAKGHPQLVALEGDRVVGWCDVDADQTAGHAALRRAGHGAAARVARTRSRRAADRVGRWRPRALSASPRVELTVQARQRPRPGALPQARLRGGGAQAARGAGRWGVLRPRCHGAAV